VCVREVSLCGGLCMCACACACACMCMCACACACACMCVHAGVPAAERVESVHCRDAEVLGRLGARGADGDSAQAQPLVVTETRPLHQLLHGGLLRGPHGAAGRGLPVIRY